MQLGSVGRSGDTATEHPLRIGIPARAVVQDREILVRRSESAVDCDGTRVRIRCRVRVPECDEDAAEIVQRLGLIGLCLLRQSIVVQGTVERLSRS